MAWHIEVDLDLCQSHGVCEIEAPALFMVPRREKVRVQIEAPEDSHRAAAEMAVRYCPTRALRIVET
jgi:ferredoxin